MLTRVLVVLAGASVLLQPGVARSEVPPAKERPLIIATAIGVRMFHPDLELNDDFAFGGKVGMGLGRRWAVLLDFIASHPHREVTARACYVDAMRFLARANLRTGRFRPYVVGGIGGVLFMFNDTPSTAGGTLTSGIGADYRVAPQTAVYIEGSADFYSQEEITYDSEGNLSFNGPSHARTLGTISTGLEVEF